MVTKACMLVTQLVCKLTVFWQAISCCFPGIHTLPNFLKASRLLVHMITWDSVLPSVDAYEKNTPDWSHSKPPPTGPSDWFRSGHVTQACLVGMNLGDFAQNTEVKGSCKWGGVAGQSCWQPQWEHKKKALWKCNWVQKSQGRWSRTKVSRIYFPGSI